MVLHGRNGVEVRGYLRDVRGTWRYEANGMAVPGAGDVTLNRLWRFPRLQTSLRGGERGAVVAVPTELLGFAEELRFASAYVADRARVTWGNAKVDAVLVPKAAWDDEAAVVRGIDAPELAPHRMVDTTRLAAALGVATSTVRSYTRRGYLPAPTVEGLSSPLWAIPPLVFALRKRAGQGVPTPTRPTHSSPRSNSRALRDPGDLAALLARVDSQLAQFDATFANGDRFDDDLFDSSDSGWSDDEAEAPSSRYSE